MTNPRTFQLRIFHQRLRFLLGLEIFGSEKIRNSHEMKEKKMAIVVLRDDSGLRVRTMFITTTLPPSNEYLRNYLSAKFSVTANFASLFMYYNIHSTRQIHVRHCLPPPHLIA